MMATSSPMRYCAALMAGVSVKARRASVVWALLKARGPVDDLTVDVGEGVLCHTAHARCPVQVKTWGVRVHLKLG